MVKKLWDVKVTFLHKGKEIKRAPITIAASTEDEARDKATDEVLQCWEPCIVLKVGEVTLLWEPKEEAKVTA
jgi:hypothetical protein